MARPSRYSAYWAAGGLPSNVDITSWSGFVLGGFRRFHGQRSLDTLFLDRTAECVRLQEGARGRVVIGKAPAAAVETRPAAATLLFCKKEVGMSEFRDQLRTLQYGIDEDIAHPVLLNTVELMTGKHVPVRSNSHVFDTSATSIDALAEAWPCLEIQLEMEELKPRT